MRPLSNDTLRCFGDECHEKESCLRFLTMRVDPPDTVLTYTLTLRGYSPAPCPEKISGDVSDFNPL